MTVDVFDYVAGWVPRLFVLAVLWLGTLALRAEKTAGTWTMLVGTVISTFAPLFGSFVLVRLLTSGDSMNHDARSVVLTLNMGANVSSKVGEMIFVIGFALFALKRRSARERQQQLEAMTAAMAEDLRVLRERAG